jgi:phthiodiolone/phenolphthiodiolone dimycocerosates ketoreductase
MEVGMLISPAGDLAAILPRTVDYLNRLQPDVVWSSDGMLRNGAPQLGGYPGCPAAIATGGLLDPYVVLATLAPQLHYRPGFGVAVTDFIRRKPADLARCAATLTQVTGRAFNMGFGVGVPNNIATVGYTYPERPVAHFEQQLQDFSSINGDRTDRVAANAAELGYDRYPCTIWIGGQRDRMLGLAARHAAGWIPSVKMTADDYGARLELLRSRAAECMRPCPKAGMFVSLILGPSRQAIFERIEQHPIMKLGALFGTQEAWSAQGHQYPLDVIPQGGGGGSGNIVLREIPAPRLHALLQALPAELIGTVYFVGNAAEVADQLYPFRANGLEHLAIPLPTMIEAGIGLDAGLVFEEYRKLVAEISTW